MRHARAILTRPRACALRGSQRGLVEVAWENKRRENVTQDAARHRLPAVGALRPPRLPLRRRTPARPLLLSLPAGRGRLRKQYVRRSDVERVRGQCQARRRELRELADWREVWRQVMAQVRDVEQR